MNHPIVISIDGDEPITLAEAAANMRVDNDDNSPAGFYEQDEIERAIRDARSLCEKRYELSLIRKTLEVACSSWYRPHCNWIELPLGPVRSIVSVKYFDTSGADQTLAQDQYRVSPYMREQVLLPAFGVSWPAARCDVDSIRVRYEVGYPSDDSPAEEVPGNVMRAIKLATTYFYENRGGNDDEKIEQLLIALDSLVGPDRLGVGV